MSESLKKKTIANISYSAIGRVVSFAFQAITNIVMSRELGASDYGIVGFAMIFVNFLKGFGDLGINTAAIQRKEMDERALGTAFTLKFALGIVAYLFAFVIAGFAPVFFNNPSIVMVIRLLALNIIINTFVLIPGVVLSRALNYKYITISETLISIVSSAVAIYFALNGFKFWSIVIANVVSNMAFVAAMNFFSPHRIRFYFDKTIAYSYLKYGSRIFLAGLLSFAVFNFDNFVVGAVAGDTRLGFYIIAFNWGSMICSIMTGTVLNILFPTLSSMQGDAEKTVQAYKKIIEYVALCSVLFNTVLFCASGDFLVHVLGKGTDKWIPALMALRILCIYGVARSLLEVVSTYFSSKGLAGIVLKANFLVAVLELVFVYPAVLYGSIELVAVVVLFTYIASAWVYLTNLSLIGISVLDLLKPVRPAILSLFTTMLVYYCTIQFLPKDIYMLFTKVILVSIVFCTAYCAVTRFNLLKVVLHKQSA